MLYTMLKSKIHSARVTSCDLHYEGSCTIDMDLVDKCKMRVNEQIQVVNVNNGARFVTYIIPGERGSGVIGLNGACARLAQLGDKVIIMCYGQIADDELEHHKPNILVLNEDNKIIMEK